MRDVRGAHDLEIVENAPSRLDGSVRIVVGNRTRAMRASVPSLEQINLDVVPQVGRPPLLKRLPKDRCRVPVEAMRQWRHVAASLLHDRSHHLASTLGCSNEVCLQDLLRGLLPGHLHGSARGDYGISTP